MYQKHTLVIALSLSLVFFAGCTKKGTSVPVAVEVSASKSQTIRLPVDSVVVSGSVKSGLTDNTIYLWTIVSGPGVPVFSHHDATSTVVGNLVAGKYILLFSATNNQGSTGNDTTSIIVAEAITKTLVLQPGSSSTEANPNSYYLTGNGNGITQISAIAWTHSGADERLRTYIKFDYGGLPSGAIITSAQLTLSSTLTPGGGNGADAQFGTQNACYVQRIATDWNIASLNWNNQPTSTDVHAAVIPQSTSSFETDVVDVTQMVKDMVASNNYGFAIKLQNEVIYNSRQYASSFYADATLHPKLVITYQQP